MRVRLVGLAILIFAVASCSTGFSNQSASETTVPNLKSIRRIDTQDHIVYFGSDDDWHYFYRSQLFGGGSYKIARSALVFGKEFSVDAAVSTPESPHRADFLDGFFEPKADGTFVYESYRQHLERTGAR